MSSKATFKSYNETAIALQEKAIKHFIWNCCLTCESWKDAKCSKFNAVPPAEVITVGCIEHVPKIPF